MTMGVAPMRSGMLDAKKMEFLAIAVDASCTHMYGPGVRRHIQKALKLGAIKEESPPCCNSPVCSASTR
jgi:alkylhydroperoxidase/carboxymuconolactone decarboxylase family protein YurZ